MKEMYERVVVDKGKSKQRSFIRIFAVLGSMVLRGPKDPSKIKWFPLSETSKTIQYCS